MSAIDSILSNKPASWIQSRVDELPDRAKFRALNSLRSLRWANDIFDAGMPVPACFCALHAAEEAVAAFVSCAKVFGYADAKGINLKDHASKAIVSLLVSYVSKLLREKRVSIAVYPDTDTLWVRYNLDDQEHFSMASLKLIHFRDGREQVLPNFYEELTTKFGGIDDLKVEVAKLQQARNEIMYASASGMPKSFVTPEKELVRNCKVSLGLIWAALDIMHHKNEPLLFVEQGLRTANNVTAALNK